MTAAVAFSGTTSQSVGSTEQTIGNSGAAITTAGTYQLMLDTNAMVGGTTQDIVEVRVYAKPASGGTERLIDAVQLSGEQSVAFLGKPYLTPISIRFAVVQPQGTARAMPYGIWSA
jgi:hypothetical protein